MDCRRCKRSLAAEAKFCPYCGASQAEKKAKPYEEVMEMFNRLVDSARENESACKSSGMMMLITCRMFTEWIYGTTEVNLLEKLLEK